MRRIAVHGDCGAVTGRASELPRRDGEERGDRNDETIAVVSTPFPSNRLTGRSEHGLLGM
ncbi:hypothetical protein [Haloprofundus salinisoli]|uniref:hypothetical protein n=1 Tax=Haloprofundus salinisoli TaxID=2876193 RepID=UPI001CC9988F|nr:hypothetical protein [Haloprofundus salinisoli]